MVVSRRLDVCAVFLKLLEQIQVVAGILGGVVVYRC